MRFAVILLLAAAPAWGQYLQPLDPLQDMPRVAEPVRDADGSIHRSSAVLTRFRKLYPCPSTGLTFGACPGWRIDHVRPLACGFPDAVSNLQWLPHIIKSGPGELPKDRWERKVYCGSDELLPMPAKALPLTVVSP
jgi:hypothetical protein